MAYFMGPVHDQRDDCRLVPNKEVSSVELAKINVELAKVDMSGDWQAQLEKLAKVYEMMYRDEVHISPSTMPDYEKKLKIFFEEHMHKDPELRFIKEGSGFFDVRSESDEWIRIPVTSGDFIYLPAGIYHRFSPDWSENIVAIRLFQSNPKWEAYDRENDGEAQEERVEYLRSIGKI